ncbi:predicted protein [Uncinocarpus reesii 1704]|uniref:Uncharacterized protein n=1 Tax=Uncinocarpus reesii (strain UAMH 1704) TaxID=336963 RepID=C4JWS1_UNCRE|nr:uncharacterized protein UREG_07013 [Uncinocarpus reesii 1704]EEP82148.1 predicted protein [Uncinocarpus reesii 1704]
MSGSSSSRPAASITRQSQRIAAIAHQQEDDNEDIESVLPPESDEDIPAEAEKTQLAKQS